MSETKEYLRGFFPQVQELAKTLGVDIEWWDFDGQYHQVSEDTLLAVLDALGFPLYSAADLYAAHDTLHREYWLSTLPQGLVLRQSAATQVPVHVPHGTEVTVELHFETGARLDLEQIDRWVDPVTIDDTLWGEATFEIPANLELGYHHLVAHTETGEHRVQVAVVPDRLDLGYLETQRSWGVMSQIYSVTSRESWGVGDFADLQEIARIFGHRGADFVLTNPLHAAEPQVPLTPSPYLPVSRRFLNPLYIRPQNIYEYENLDAAQQAQVKVAFARATNDPVLDDAEKQIDRNRAWSAKLQALRLIYRQPRSHGREECFLKFKEQLGQSLQDFALWCALYETQGAALIEDPQLRDINSPKVARLRAELQEEIEFYSWLQWITSDQLHDAQAAAIGAGMRIGIMNDLAVGVHKTGADVWCLPEAFLDIMSVGAPPDMYNRLGQDWSQPPLNPRYLQTHDWEPLRGLFRSALRHCGGLRIDHVMGLLRLWWIPQGKSPAEGTYVRYRHEATVGILLLEAARRGAVVIGEDLGTVEPWVRDYLSSRGVFGTSVMWFEREGSSFRAADSYREMCMAAVNTHDLPPTLGYLRGVHLYVQDQLGILPHSLEESLEGLNNEVAKLIEQLRQWGLLETEQPTETELIAAMHRFITATPAKLTVMSLVDAVGDIRMQNQPGTNNEYPNWRIPLADSLGRPLHIEEIEHLDTVADLAGCMSVSPAQN